MKKVVVLGAGESGVGAALLAKAKGHEVFVTDKGAISPEHKRELAQALVPFEEGAHSMERLLDADLAVLSPGIPMDAPVVVGLRAAGILVVSEIEFAGWHTEAFIIGITGTNGKTTTTKLIHYMLASAGLDVGLAGNVGHSFARAVAAAERQVFVLELSSFQLDGIVDFAPDIAVMLNITPDHLDRYNHRFEQYVDSKFRIAVNQKGHHHMVFCLDDPTLAQEVLKRTLKAIKHSVSIHTEKGQAAFVREGKLFINQNKQEEEIMSMDELALKGPHNASNSLAAAAVGSLMKIRKHDIRESLRTFENEAHRLELVMSLRGVNFFNDSKATNVNATWYALQSMEGPTVWMVGGVDKGNDYGQLDELVAARVKAIVCIGNDNRKIMARYASRIYTVEARDMRHAVAEAFRLSDQGDSVLLSPACASFDWFKSYEDRGDQFKAAVREL